MDTETHNEEQEEVLRKIRNRLLSAEEKLEKNVTDFDIALIWVPAISARYYRGLSPAGEETIVDRIGNIQQTKPDGMRSHVADRILRDLHQIPMPALVNRVINVWRVMEHATEPGSLYAQSEEDRFAALWGREYRERPGASLPGSSMLVTLQSTGGLSPHQHHRFRLWMEREHHVTYRATNKGRVYEGIVPRGVVQAEERARVKAEAEPVTGDKTPVETPSPVTTEPPVAGDTPHGGTLSPAMFGDAAELLASMGISPASPCPTPTPEPAAPTP